MRQRLLLPPMLAACLIIANAPQAAVIAVIDSGIAPIPELAPHLAPGGFDFVNNDPDATDDNGHGTVLAAIAVSSSNFTAQVMPIKILDATGSGALIWGRQGIAHAASRPNVRILNLSTQSMVYDLPVVASLQSAAGAGKIIVMAAGNTGLPNPDFPAGIVNQLSGRGIAVGAVGPGNVIRPYTARAGNSMNSYLVALDDLGLGLLGTSFAAPQVSGAAALVLHNAPFLSANEVVDILLRTAVDLGAPGTDPIYGRGLLNPSAALMPVGPPQIPTGDTVADSGASIQRVALELGPAVAGALMDNGRLAKTVIVDEYKRPFVVNLKSLASIHDPRPTWPSLLDDLRGLSEPLDVPLASKHKLSLWLSPPVFADSELCSVFCDFDPSEGATEIAMSLSSVSNKGLHYHLNLNTDLGTPFGANQWHRVKAMSLLSRRSLLSPYLSFGERSNSAGLGYGFGRRIDVALGFVATDEGDAHGRRSDAALIEGNYELSDWMSLTAQLTTLSEDGNLLGGASNGAFGVDQSNTTAVSVGARLQLRPSLALVGHYTRGHTRVDDVEHSLLHDFSSLRSEAFSAALFANGVIRKDDQVAIAVSRPLRVTDGSVDMEIPYARDYAGNVLSNTERISLVPQGKETDVEISYRFPLREHTTVGANLLYRAQPDHRKASGPETGVYAVLRHDF